MPCLDVANVLVIIFVLAVWIYSRIAKSIEVDRNQELRRIEELKARNIQAEAKKKEIYNEYINSKDN